MRTLGEAGEAKRVPNYPQVVWKVLGYMSDCRLMRVSRRDVSGLNASSTQRVEKTGRREGEFVKEKKKKGEGKNKIKKWKRKGK